MRNLMSSENKNTFVCRPSRRRSAVDVTRHVGCSLQYLHAFEMGLISRLPFRCGTDQRPKLSALRCVRGSQAQALRGPAPYAFTWILQTKIGARYFPGPLFGLTVGYPFLVDAHCRPRYTTQVAFHRMRDSPSPPHCRVRRIALGKLPQCLCTIIRALLTVLSNSLEPLSHLKFVEAQHLQEVTPVNQRGASA